ncbi:MAG: 7-carboxy-7-deazaguanine synthase QueE [Acidimicrobiales bacterium]|nr:7-carboxy-7-deazaguanine synthase QueE [Acidimicrobiales bacterium]
MTDAEVGPAGDSPDEPVFATEVFSAIQGEGALVGTRQVFVRLAGCNIRCSYCDQPEALERRPGPCRVERTPGHRDWRDLTSPLPVAELVALADGLGRQLPHHSVSLTGGEPLFQGRACAGVAAGLSTRGWAVMLETNGTLPTALARMTDALTYVSMDLKLPSVDGERVAPERQREFLDVALAAGLETWVKVVVGPATDEGELDGAVRMVAEAAAAAPVRPGTANGARGPEIFLQPVTPFGAVQKAPSPELVLELQGRALSHYPRVRVVPQTHKAIGQL